MSNPINDMLLENYFEHAKQNFNMDDASAEQYAQMRFENEGDALSEAQIRDLVGAPTKEEQETCMCGDPVDTCPDAYSHMTQGV